MVSLKNLVWQEIIIFPDEVRHLKPLCKDLGQDKYIFWCENQFYVISMVGTTKNFNLGLILKRDSDGDLPFSTFVGIVFISMKSVKESHVKYRGKVT